MPQGYEIVNDKGERAWWDGKKVTPLTADGLPDAGAGRVTEAERTAGFLATRAANSASSLADINERNPGASRPNVFEAAATSWNKPGAANLFRGADRQQVWADQLDLLDSALTLGTGAAYTREQLENYRSTYFPGLTDQPATVAHKRKKLLSLLEAAKVKAGGAAPPVLENAIQQLQVQFEMQPGSQANPFRLTEANRSTIGEGQHFRAGDGKVYRQKKGAGFGGKGAQGGSTGFSDPAKEARYQAWLKANAGR